jgi:hypothetical protein
MSVSNPLAARVVESARKGGVPSSAIRRAA